MINRRDFLKGIVTVGGGIGGLNLFSDSWGNISNASQSADDEILITEKKDKTSLPHPLAGCELTTLARVTQTYRAKLEGWASDKDCQDYNWGELDAYCIGMDNFDNLFPLHLIFFTANLKEMPEGRMREKIALSRGQDFRDLIETLKDRILQDLQENSIIRVRGPIYVESPVFINMDPRYQLLRDRISETEARKILEEPKRIKRLKESLAGFSWGEDFFPRDC